MSALLWDIATRFAKISLVSIGGANAALPEIHREVVTLLHWMDDATFARLFAISQAAPGPNIQFVSLIGWHQAGLAGLLVATLAIILPSSLLAFGAGRAMTRWAETAWVGVAKAALVPLAIGLMLASGVVSARAADTTALGLIITAGAAAFLLTSRRNPLWALAAGMIVSVVASRLGIPP